MNRAKYTLSILFFLSFCFSSCDNPESQSSEVKKPVSVAEKHEKPAASSDYVKRLFNSYGNKLNCIVSQYLIEVRRSGKLEKDTAEKYELDIIHANCLCYEEGCMNAKKLEILFDSIPDKNQDIFQNLKRRQGQLAQKVDSENFIIHLDSLSTTAHQILTNKRYYSTEWGQRLSILRNSTISEFNALRVLSSEESVKQDIDNSPDPDFMNNWLSWFVVGLIALILIALVYLFSQIRGQKKLITDISNRLNSKSKDLNSISLQVEGLSTSIRQNNRSTEPEKASHRIRSQQPSEPQTYTLHEINAKLEPQRLIDLKEWSNLFTNLHRKNKLYYLVKDEIDKLKMNYDLDKIRKEDFDQKLDAYLVTLQEKLRQSDKELIMDTYYSPPPSPEGYFPDEKKKPELDPNKHTYRIDVNSQTPTEATFLFLTQEESAVSSALTNYAYELEPVCEIEGGHLEGKHIVQDKNQPGRLKLEGGKWMVTEKLRIRIE
ncbi:MAG: hypothetical protein CMI36_13305 [Owenweeksia sp.]|nr:hypothetical protein [Owenweeksia sp.]MBF99965.1 hypothetical protein [Owenweeksia sp.]|tara:strand:+ start:1603 stop:3066 length:1464 start_codon:yes stop_codon:yes gene_type:complete